MNIHSRRRFVQMIYTLSVSFSIFLSTAVLGALPDQDFWLITPQEAAMKPAPISPLDEMSGGVTGNGPIVELEKPQTENQIESPVEIAINFQNRLAEINLDSLSVEVVKFINIDITDRIKPYVTVKGIHIPDAPLPSGEHTILLYIEDVEGNPTDFEMTITVA